MNFKQFVSEAAEGSAARAAADLMKADAGDYVLCGLSGSAPALLMGMAQAKTRRKAVYLLADEDEAGYFYGDLVQAIGEAKVFFFPSSYKKRGRSAEAKDPANQVLRTEALNALQAGECLALVTYPEAMAEKTVSSELLRRETLTVAVGDSCGLDFVAETLAQYGFNLVDFVYEPGQYSLRGSLIDVFSFSSDLPYRIDFFGDDVDSIRSFDVESQLSVQSLEKVSIVSAMAEAGDDDMVPATDFFEASTLICFRGRETFFQLAEKAAKGRSENFISGDELRTELSRFRTAEISPSARPGAPMFAQTAQPLFHKNFDLVCDDFRDRISRGYKIFVLSENSKQTARLADIFAEKDESIHFTPVEGQIHEGFIDDDAKICVYTDHQIFDRFHKYTLKSARARDGRVAMSMKELMQLRPGDYVVHETHGVGRFGGLVSVDMNGKKQEVIKIIYKDNDMILVNVHSLHRISKYRSKDGMAPVLHRLGSDSWSKLRERTKKKVKDIARELIRIYAERRSEKGFAFSHDSYMQQELESSFIYEDTPDQTKATIAVKKDMESSKPMDRLICGDVGFGKTEVAIRAAFKAVADSKQVAVLVPTTVLAFQHYKSFSRRLKRFPCKIEYLSRSLRPAEAKDILKRTAEGRVDILIGTHKLLGKEVRFKDLGLLIIDEEQKFGVAAKEKLRQKRSTIDTLTLTATPIPRTLQFSLMGARDLSIINTPPPNRYPVHTEIIGFDEETIKEAMEFELARSGQIFFVNNHIADLPSLELRLRKLVPQARICICHGQMEGEKMESLLLDFIAGEYDVLLCTSIIESGVDIPNVNTMFVNNAQHFGLSDLHQLRGRVGRTNKKAFCYLISPPLGDLPPDSRRRLEAIENFSDLGSGINIAMQDLDIRGAGNILGSEQSGFMADLGFETYHKILDEAVRELKTEEFADVFAEEIKAADEAMVSDCVFESDLPISLPASYVESTAERIDLYRRLDLITDPAQIEKMESELTDRFGPLPDEGRDLLRVVSLRLMARGLGIEKITIMQGKLKATFVSNPQSAFYGSDIFGRIIAHVAASGGRLRLRELSNKRILAAEGVENVSQAMELMELLAS